jgi:glycerate-2-kinase
VTSRDAVRAIWEAALAAGDAAPLVRAHLRLDRGPARVFLLGAGKASGAMAAAA